MATHSFSNQSPCPLLPLVAASIFLLPLYLLFRSSKSGKSGTQGAKNAPCPPGPPKQLPVLGNLLQLGSRPHRYFQAVARSYGPVVLVHLGRLRTVVVSSPEAAKEVLRTNDQHCCSHPNSPGKCIIFIFRPLLCSSL